MLLQYLANKHGESKHIYTNFNKDRDQLCYGSLCMQNI